MKRLATTIFFVLLFLFPAPIKAQDDFLNESTISLEKENLPKEIVLSINNSEYTITKPEFFGWFEEEIDLKINPSYSSEIENINLCNYKKSLTCRLVLLEKNKLHTQKIYHRTINQAALKNFVEDLARKINKDPENAKLEIRDDKVSAFALSTPGVELKQKESVINIKKYLLESKQSDKIILPFKKIEPEISTDSIDNLGITELIGEGKSNFIGSPKNRVYNIKVATNRFNGLLIKPGEEFSFVKNLGEVDAEHGYLPELVIKNDKTEPEFGGGICQVSTTAFRAAIYSGLEITARRNHAYPVSYYNPQGMDATVYIPRPDLRFINDTPNYILIQTKIKGTELIFQFYGTSDGRKVEIEGPTILERNPDGSMKTVFTQEVLDKNNNTIRKDVFQSAYDSPSKYPHPGEDNDEKDD